MIKIETNKIYEIQKQMFWVLFLLVSILGVVYIYLTAVSIVDVASRKRIEKEVVEMKGRAVQMELVYLEKESGITQDLAASQGYVEPKAEFASRAYNVAALSLRNEN